MPTLKQWKLTKDWTPAVIGADETAALFNVAAGVRVISASYRVKTNAAAGTDSTASLGDGSGVASFVAAIDTELGTLGDGAGAYLANAGGKLYTADDTIDVTYAHGTTPGATKPVIAFTVTFRREWP